MLANLQGLSVKVVSSCSWGPAGAPALCLCPLPPLNVETGRAQEAEHCRERVPTAGEGGGGAQKGEHTRGK